MKKLINVVQADNPRYVSNCPTGGEEKNRVPYCYQVISTQNVVKPTISEWLLPSQISDLIDLGVDVHIK